MKITAVEALPIDRYLLAQVHTDAGITGLGEVGCWGHFEASEAALHKFADYLVDRDPFQIEHHLNAMHRWSYFRGAAIMGAISAIDIALWDIKGKALGVPVYELLGGKARDRARLYVHVKAATQEEQIEGCIEARRQGFTAVGHLNPFLDEPFAPYFKTHARKIDEAVESVRRYREAVGNDVDLCLEIHRRLFPAEAITLGRALESFHPFFYEDPIPPDSIDSMGDVAANIGIPVATGERLISLQEFAMLLERRGAQYLRPCVCAVGGISTTKKIAALAEARLLEIVPHNPFSAVSTAACLQVAIAIPNLALLEYTGEDDGTPLAEMVVNTHRIEDGFLVASDAPGIGVELAPDVQKRFPVRPRKVRARLHRDGSVVQQ